MASTYDMAELFARVARDLEAGATPQETQELVTRAAVDTVPGCDSAGISLIRSRGRIVTVAATDPVVAQVDAIQYELGEGPCLGAIADHVIYTVDDFRDTSTIWPRFAGRIAAEVPIGCMLAFRLFTSGDTVGALNLFGREPRGFTDDSRAIGAILAAHAAIALVAAREHQNAENLETALNTSRQIGMAVGIVMEQKNLDQDRAFDFLVDASQRLNRKLRDLADAIVSDRGVLGR